MKPINEVEILKLQIKQQTEQIYELYKRMEDLCINQIWPVEKLSEKNVKTNIAIQINGKTRSVIIIDNDTKKEKVLEMAREDKNVLKYLGDKKIIREIYVPGKIINFVL